MRVMYRCADPEGAGGPHPLKNHKAIGFLSNIGPDSLENQKANKSACNIGPRSASADPEGGGGQGVWTPLENHKLYGLL